jgi:hypothetical protein
MKLLFTFIAFILFSLTVQAQQSDSVNIRIVDASKPVQKVEAACGQCKLGLAGKGCNLAIRINGKAYFVDGTKIDDHGDAHDDDGFCNTIRQAKVQGAIVDNRFKVTYFKLLDTKKKN